MYIDKHYPFEMITLKYPLSGFEDFLDFQTLSIHYNQIYKGYIENLNKYLDKVPSLKELTLDEILFNETIIPVEYREKIINSASGVYNHQEYFNSITPNPIVLISSKLKNAIEKRYTSLNNFYKEFKSAALNLSGCGFVYLACNKKGDVFITSVKGNKTTVPMNLCPIITLDMFEHAYFLKYKNDKASYIDNFLKYICFDYANKNYEDCLKAIYEQNKN